MKKIPERMCVVCRKMFPKNELIRVVKNENGVYEVDTTGKKNGRGAYVCSDCVSKCVDKKLLDKILKAHIEDNVYTDIEEYGHKQD